MKKKTRRDSSKYPNLDIDLNTKRRRYYIDNVEYIDGVKNENDELVIRQLTDSEKEYLNKFNGEYYNADFDANDENNLHKSKVDSVTISNIRDSIRKLKSGIRKESCPVALKAIYDEIEDLNVYLHEVYPKKGCTDSNNSRNRCLVNKARGDNSYRLVSVETMKQSELETASEDYNVVDNSDFSVKEINYILESDNTIVVDEEED